MTHVSSTVLTNEPYAINSIHNKTLGGKYHSNCSCFLQVFLFWKCRCQLCHGSSPTHYISFYLRFSRHVCISILSLCIYTQSWESYCRCTTNQILPPGHLSCKWAVDIDTKFIRGAVLKPETLIVFTSPQPGKMGLTASLWTDGKDLSTHTTGWTLIIQ